MQPLMEAGLDSLGAVELRNTIGAHFALEVPATLTFDYPSISAMAAFLAPRTASSGGVRAGTALDARSGVAALAGGQAASAAPVQASDIVGIACRYPGGAHLQPTLYAFTIIVLRSEHCDDIAPTISHLTCF